MQNSLYYGDNLDVLRKYVNSESIDLCYIDPPFNSKRNYNQIYNNIGDDKAQSQAFIDTWTWNDYASNAYDEIITNSTGGYTSQTIDLIKGFKLALGTGSLMAYLVNMAQRVNEIFRVLKPTGSFYLHCDPTASHYLKILLDSIFCGSGRTGDFRNEIVWHYSGWNAKLKQSFNSRHDIILFYSKGMNQFNSYGEAWKSIEEYIKTRKQKVHTDETGRTYVFSDAGKGNRIKRYIDEAMQYGKPISDVWEVDKLNNSSKEKLGYPTQKPEALLERIILASSNENDVVLDAFCGCGTTVAVAQRLKRNWIGIDITYQSISLILKRLEDQFGEDVKKAVNLTGIPRDIESATLLANKQDDRLRKEFEKWAVLTYSNNRAIINDKKGADKGVDGVSYFITGSNESGKIIYQVKSGKVQRNDIATLNSDRIREKAELAIFITLLPPTKAMLDEVASIEDKYSHPLLHKKFNRVQIVTIKDMMNGERLELAHTQEVFKKAEQVIDIEQNDLDI